MIELRAMTRQLCHEFYREYENDTDLFMDMSKFFTYQYDEEKVNKYYDSQQRRNRIVLTIIHSGKSVGQLTLKNIDYNKKECTLSIILQNNSVKGRGIGTLAEKLALEYAFNEINMEVVNADTVIKNKRSQHVLEKVGFKLIRENEMFKYYQYSREDYIKNGGSTIFCIDKYDEKEKIAKEILTDLPEWFGLPDSTAEYVNNCKEMLFWTYIEEGKSKGFIVLKETSDYTVEVYVMGVLKNYHRSNIGTKLFQKFYEYAKQEGYSFIQVKTVKEGCYEEYDKTIGFYKKLGFREFECIPTLWDEWNPCQIYIMSII